MKAIRECIFINSTGDLISNIHNQLDNFFSKSNMNIYLSDFDNPWHSSVSLEKWWKLLMCRYYKIGLLLCHSHIELRLILRLQLEMGLSWGWDEVELKFSWIRVEVELRLSRVGVELRWVDVELRSKWAFIGLQLWFNNIFGLLI